MQDLYEKLHADDGFHELERKRRCVSWPLAAAVLCAYFGFILIIAFAPHVFARPIFPGRVVTWGIPAGVAVIALGFTLTGFYVYWANREFDRLMRDLITRVVGRQWTDKEEWEDE